MTARKRKEDTRKKILAGALVLAEQDLTIRAWLTRTLNRALKRSDERALFGLPPLPEEPGVPLQADAPPTFGKKAPGAKSTREDESV